MLRDICTCGVHPSSLAVGPGSQVCVRLPEALACDMHTFKVYIACRRRRRMLFVASGGLAALAEPLGEANWLHPILAPRMLFGRWLVLLEQDQCPNRRRSRSQRRLPAQHVAQKLRSSRPNALRSQKIWVGRMRPCQRDQESSRLGVVTLGYSRTLQRRCYRLMLPGFPRGTPQLAFPHRWSYILRELRWQMRTLYTGDI